LEPLKIYIPSIEKIIQKISQKFENLPLVFFHGDFCFRNIIVNISTKEISGLLDWEWAGSFPLFKEWSDGIKELEGKDLELFFEECKKENMISPKENFPYFENHLKLFQLVENLTPWYVGIFGDEEEDRKALIKCKAEVKTLFENLL